MAKQDGESGRGRAQRGDTGAVWGTGIGRRRPRPDRRAVLGSVAFHVLLLAGLYAAGLHRATLPEFEVVRVQLRSPPPQVAAETQVIAPPAPDPIVVREAPPTREETPAPTPPRPAEEPKPQPEVAKPAETPPRPVKTPEKTVEDPPKEPVKSAGRNADEASTGGENIDVDMEGRDFPYPEYLQNVITQLHRHFRWAGNPNLQAEVAFYIQRDGSAGGITVSSKSGDFNFDMEAMAAVEQVGRRGLFGPLPDGWVSDRLWIRFRFLPPGT